MRRYSVLGWMTLATALFAVRPAKQETPVGHTWEYRGTVTVTNTDGEQRAWHHNLHVTATQADKMPADRPPILRFRTAQRGEEADGTATAESAAWIQTPGRYAGHLPAAHSMPYALEMADALPLPRPFTTRLNPREVRTVSLPLFSLNGDLVPLRQQVVGQETIASRPCYRVERTAKRAQPLGAGMLLETYKETLWVDRADGTLMKYQGQAQIAQPSSVMQITTILQREAVRPIGAEEWRQREQQAGLLREVLRFLDANPFPGKEQADEVAQAQQQLDRFRKTYPDSPYRVACDSLQATLARAVQVLEREQQQADMVGKLAPAFALRDLSGKIRSLAEFRGRVVLLNFFASWCGPCNEEVPHLETEFWEKRRAQGLVVLGIDGKEEDNPLAKAQGFRDGHKLTYPILIDTESKTTAAYRVQAIPMNVVIDRDGIVRYVAAGFDADALNTALRPLLKP